MPISASPEKVTPTPTFPLAPMIDYDYMFALFRGEKPISSLW